jgi:hypothetical protein
LALFQFTPLYRHYGSVILYTSFLIQEETEFCIFPDLNRKKHKKLSEISIFQDFGQFVVGEDGFEPSKQSQQIYSLPPLAAREFSLELVDGIEPPTY